MTERSTIFRLTVLVSLVVAFAALSGCATQRGAAPLRTTAALGDYPSAFAAARDTLRRRGFVLDRVDASAGVISTHPKTSAGLATPWSPDQIGFDQELADLANPHERRVTIRFLPENTGSVRMEVDVIVDRVRRPGWQIETESISRSRYAVDPTLGVRGMSPVYRTPNGRDDRLGADILRDIIERASRADESARSSEG